MINFKPLRDYCYEHDIKLTNLVVECGFSKNLATKIKKNENIELRALERICLRLDIPIQDTVRFEKD